MSTRPDAFPWTSHDFDLGGATLRFVDEGSGPPIVFVHGTPTWGYLYRRLIGALAPDYRVVAPDHLGFGRSDKPRDASYEPAAHARNLERLLERLELDDVVLVAHDFGGPIGLSWALDHPERVRGVVLFNTWMWSLDGSPNARIARVLGSRFGRVLYERFNLSPRVLLKAAFADRSRLSREAHRRYLEPFASSRDRRAPWVFARELLASGPWYDALWRRREDLAGIPMLILWGMRDPAFGGADLARWRAAFPDARVASFEDAGHFVQEEAPEAAEAEIRAFLAELRTKAERN